MKRNLQEQPFPSERGPSGNSVFAVRIESICGIVGVVLLLLSCFFIIHKSPTPKRHATASASPQPISAEVSIPDASRVKPASFVPAAHPDDAIVMTVDPYAPEVHEGPLLFLDTNGGGALWQIKGSSQMIFCYTSHVVPSCFQIK